MHGIIDMIHTPGQASNGKQLLALQIEKALLEILKSAPFRGSKQSQHLLQFIVTQSLEGHSERLKERIIGAEVFGRAIDYDTNVDPIVRSRATELRKRLAQYYIGEGKDCPIRIEFSPGSYQATFSDIAKSSADHAAAEQARIQTQTLEAAGSESVAGILQVARTKRVAHRLRYLIPGIALVLLVGGVIAFALRSPNPVKLFWSPLLEARKPVLIYTGANPVYMPSDQLIERFKASHHLSELESGGREFLIPLSENPKLEPGDFLEMKDAFVTLGDVNANVSVSSLLTRFDHAFDLRSGEDVAFGDLRDSPVILIGAFNNTWTLQLTGDLPFVFGSGLTIREHSGNGRQWQPVYSSERTIKVDYALVARLPHANSGGTLIAIAGITQSGTRAAAEFITSADGIRLLAKSMPEGWTSKNLEFVLETKVVNNIPTSPSVVATRIW